MFGRGVQKPLLDITCAKNAQIYMSRQLPPLNALRAFEAAGRHQSFSRAAEELSVSHSSISRHVRGLEHRLGAPLFRTEQRGVALTEAGQRYPRPYLARLRSDRRSDRGAGRTPRRDIGCKQRVQFRDQMADPRASRIFALGFQPSTCNWTCRRISSTSRATRRTSHCATLPRVFPMDPPI